MQDNKNSSLVNWVGYLAITLLVILPLSVLTVRSGAWQQGLLLYALACLGSVVLLALSLVLLALPRFATQRRAVLSRAAFTLPGALLFLMLLGGGDYPAIHDITTDTEDPPVFAEAPAQRGKTSNSLDIKPESIEAQRAAYPDIATLVSALPLEETYALALQTATGMGWEVYRDDLNAGYIEAVATTGIMAFKDDVVIRVRTTEAGTVVDLRSVSRVGRSDLGANAARIREFARAFAVASGG